jgi:hypothetical protein
MLMLRAYGSHYIRCKCQTTSGRRRTMSFSHSFFSAASSNSDMLSATVQHVRPLVVLFLLRPTPPP